MSTGPRRIDAKKAVGNAKRYLVELTGKQFYELSLEEIELSKDEKYWLVTLGYPKTYLTPTKDYKLLKIDASNGDVLSMKIREPCG